MSGAVLIARKDLRLRIRDRSAFIIGIIAPLGLAFIFNLILGDLAEGTFVPVFAVTNADEGEIGAGFVTFLEQSEDEGFIDLVDAPATIDEARVAAESGEVSAVIVVPSGFSQAVTAGEPTTILIVSNPDEPTSTEIARAFTQGFTSEIQATQIAVATYAATADTPPAGSDYSAIANEFQEQPSTISVGRVETVKRELDLATFFAAAMSVFFLFFTVSFGVNGLLEEQQQGTIRRLLVAPIRVATIVGGKAIVSFVLGIVSMTILIVASSLLIGADWGNPVGVGLLVIAGVTAATGLMMVIAAFAKTPEQAGNLMAIAAVGLGMLGGIFFPTGLGDGVLSYLAYISPHRWFLLGLADLAGGDDLTTIVPSIIGLLVFAAAGWSIALIRFRTKGLAL